MIERGDEEGVAKFEFGDQCPQIGSWYFPIDPKEEPRMLAHGKEGDEDDSSQSS